MSPYKKLGPSGMIVTETTSATVSNSNVETVLFEQVIPAGTLSLSRSIKAEMKCRITSVLLPPAITIRLKFGGSTLAIVNGLAVNLNISAKPFTIEALIANKGVANAQYAYGRITQHMTQGPLSLSSPIYDNDADWTEDTTIDRTFQITAQFASLVSTTSITLKHAETCIV